VPICRAIRPKLAEPNAAKALRRLMGALENIPVIREFSRPSPMALKLTLVRFEARANQRSSEGPQGAAFATSTAKA
jgi:hypothetical protein